MTRPASVIHSDPEILGGVPVFVGTRVPLPPPIDYLVLASPSPSSWRTSRQLAATRRSPPCGWRPKPWWPMRVLLDECVPRRLGRELVGHDVRTVPQEGWSGKKNGELLALMSAARFEAF